ncbi:Thioesterase/thiol ester dehydrase-isomerase [Lentithecium fluviatile CBS 122367]|uniref:Thioesterase/thiol ester dehydrase-isomerase n=1 Tax=Lentithecium fluviatile CBS 122367 TaxID=1168545 RepID=A0A6G1JLY3_9PLEO|nr:Thioesterase/thiol ester dehydrase-isomerase [Lentithecium fluviatile CBS 122367]
MGSPAGLKIQLGSLRSNADLAPFEKTQAWLNAVLGVEGYDCHDGPLFKILKLESATLEPTKENPNDAKTVFTMTVPREYCNMAGALHGGAVSLIFDICTSTALNVCAREGFWDTGHVSRTLNCTYMRPVPQGEKIWIESEVVHLGKRMATLRGSIKNEGGKVCYLCEHQKAAVGSSSL